MLNVYISFSVLNIDIPYCKTFDYMTYCKYNTIAERKRTTTLQAMRSPADCC